MIVIDLPIADTSAVDAQGIIIPNISCDVSVYVGSVVYLNSSSIAFNAIATSITTSDIFGIVESKETTILCSVRVLGVSSSLYSLLDVSKSYYLSDTTAGGITSAAIGPGNIIMPIGRPYTSTRILLIKGTPTVRV
jgi:hypothetical protein